MGIQPLGVGPLHIAVAQGNGQGAVAEQRHAGAEVLAKGLGRLAGEQRAKVLQAHAVQPGTYHPQVIGLARAGGVGKIEQLVVRKVRVRQHLEQSRLAFAIQLGQAGYGFGLQGEPALSIRHQQAQPSGALGEQRPAVGQEGQRPGPRESGRQRLDLVGRRGRGQRTAQQHHQ